jgi:hypothetical protein
MANYRVLKPQGEVVATKDIANTELGWRMEVEPDGEWSFFDDTEGGRV